MKLLLAAPLLFSIVAFVLSLLSLLAGFKQGFMEDYNVMTFNTSALGQDAIQAVANGSISTSALGSVAAGLLDSLGGDIGNNLASQLGIGEFYSIHAMDFCQGNFEPSATTPGASHSVTNCSMPLDFAAYNFTEKLSQELSLGPFHFTLSQLGVSQSIQDTMDKIPVIAKALAALFIVTVVFTGLGMLGSAGGVLSRGGRLISLVNFVIALGAVIFLLASSLVATIGPQEVAKQIRQQGGDTVGLEVIANARLAALTWAAFALMVLSMFLWFYELVVECVRRRRASGFREKQSMTFGK